MRYMGTEKQHEPRQNLDKTKLPTLGGKVNFLRFIWISPLSSQTIAALKAAYRVNLQFSKPVLTWLEYGPLFP